MHQEMLLTSHTRAWTPKMASELRGNSRGPSVVVGGFSQSLKLSRCLISVFVCLIAPTSAGLTQPRGFGAHT